MIFPTLAEIEAACHVVYRSMSYTPQYNWPLLSGRAGCDLWLKHENHAALGAFKTRGALVYFQRLYEAGASTGVAVAATRGNFGQAVTFAARQYHMQAVIYVPRGNSPAKNRAMTALGARLVEHGDNFEEARLEALRWAAAEGHHIVPSFHPWLALGTATYSYELFHAVPDIDVAYVPIGMGSGIVGMCAARAALGLKTEIVGVVSAHARGNYDSFVQRKVVASPATTHLADGMAVPAPSAEAMEVMWEHVSRMVLVDDAEIAGAMRVIFDDTHNVAEGAGAAAVAAVLKDRHLLQGKRVAAVVSGANVDRDTFVSVLGAV